MQAHRDSLTGAVMGPHKYVATPQSGLQVPPRWIHARVLWNPLFHDKQFRCNLQDSSFD